MCVHMHVCVCVCVWYCRRFVKSESLMKNFVYICFRKEKKKRFTWLNFTRTCPVHIFPFGEKKKNENKILEFSLKFPKHMFLHCYLIFMQIKQITSEILITIMRTDSCFSSLFVIFLTVMMIFISSWYCDAIIYAEKMTVYQIVLWWINTLHFKRGVVFSSQE